MMSKSTVELIDKKQKPAKPRPDYPLTPHNSGKWCKTIATKVYYFGTWDDPHGAETLYLRKLEELGLRKKTPIVTEGYTLRDLCNHFITSKREDMEAGKLSKRTYFDYDRICRVMLATIGEHRPVADLGPDEFTKLYRKLQTNSAVALRRLITIVKSVFKMALEDGLIDRVPVYGSKFKLPSASDVRKERGEAKTLHGARLFEACDLRTILAKAGVPLKAMTLLALNAGLGNSDLAALPTRALNLDTGWLDFPRVKTGADRRAKLWPETVVALRAMLAERRKPVKPEDAKLVFLTTFGLPWVRFDVDTVEKIGKPILKAKQNDEISKSFRKLLNELKMHRKGLSFYTLRHQFRTVADASKDFPAVRLVMGHTDSSIDAAYREQIDDDRLEAVADHVHRWLFGE